MKKTNKQTKWQYKLELPCTKQGLVVDYSGCDNVPFSSTKDGKFLGHLGNYYFVKDSVVCSYF